MPNGAPSQAVDAMLREYDVLRAEIALYRQEQNRSLIFAMVGTYALASAFYVVLGGSNENPDGADADLFRRVLLLVLSLFVMINGIAFADRNRRVKRIARYLHNYLRPNLIGLLGDHHVWHWEFFKQASYTMAKIRHRILTLILDWFRLAFFWLVTLASFILYLLQLVTESACGGTLLERILIVSLLGQFLVAPLLEQFLMVFNAVASLVFLFASLRIQETKGAPSHAHLNNEIDWLSAKQIDNGKSR